ncbi:uncharacterized protein L201_000271 [Kwoniella dendrophila CBS 6074]|uniref:Uncharacterized protein n=1 Tax=Kwoniella dendrophila CBS 6074 TaxID=1295534 RepID=A0AAX4JLX9_9TREE
MGYTLQLQWSYTPPPGRQISLADIVLPRVLESYSLHTPSRSTIQFRTYRSTFPSKTSSSNSDSANKTYSRYLTTINTLPNPLPPVASGSSNLNSSISDKEDITYLFLDDRSALSDNRVQPTRTDETIGGNVRKRDSQNELIDVDKPSNSDQSQPIEIDKDTLDDDGFEIIDIPKVSEISTENVHVNATDNKAVEAKSEAVDDQPRQTQKAKKQNRFKCLVIKPTSNVQPMLQSLLSPFVMGYTKSAKAAASNTSSVPTPTPLPGSSLLLTVLTFNPFIPPSSKSNKNSLILRVFILPNPNANSIFLEAEYDNVDAKREIPDSGSEDRNRICKDFLEGCLIDGLNGTKKWIDLTEPNAEPNDEGWEGIERNKKSIFALTKTLRESGFI